MGQLTSYKRFTESSLKAGDDYGKRLHARLDHLRDGGAVAMVAPGQGGAPTSAAFLVRTSGGRDGSQLSVPLEDLTDEPVFIENIRMRPDSSVSPNGSMATRHMTVVRQGDRVISVSLQPHNQRSLDEFEERDFDFLK